MIKGSNWMMDEVTQSNAAGAEESAAAAEELNAQAEEMKRAVGELQRLVYGVSAVVTSPAQSPKTVRPAANPAKSPSTPLPEPRRLETDRIEDIPMPQSAASGTGNKRGSGPGRAESFVNF